MTIVPPDKIPSSRPDTTAPFACVCVCSVIVYNWASTAWCIIDGDESAFFEMDLEWNSSTAEPRWIDWWQFGAYVKIKLRACDSCQFLLPISESVMLFNIVNVKLFSVYCYFYERYRLFSDDRLQWAVSIRRYVIHTAGTSVQFSRSQST